MTKRNTATRDRHRAQIARDKPNCWICGQPIDYTLAWPDQRCFVVDHVVPINRGGTDTLGNKRAAHRDCNRAKSDRDFAPIIRRSGALNRPAPPK